MKRNSTEFYKKEHTSTFIYLIISLILAVLFCNYKQTFLFNYTLMMIMIFFIQLKYCRLLIENRYNTKVIVENIKKQNKVIVTPKVE